MAEKHNATVKVMGGGRITIPSDIREFESIKDGDFVKICIEKIEQSKDDNRKEPILNTQRNVKVSRRKA